MIERFVTDVCSFFFFSSRRRHTRLTCDWSSDVCSSDLVTVCIGKNTYTDKRGFDQQKSMYTLSSSLHEIATSGRHPGTRRTRAAPQPGGAPPPAAAARLRGDAGDDLAGHQGARPREARRRRRL